jgi:uncharacterized protein with PIN domain
MQQAGHILFQDVMVEPRLLGYDLRLCKLKASHTQKRKIKVQPNLSYQVHALTHETNGTMRLTIEIQYQRTNLLENILTDPQLERETSDAWKSELTVNLLDRKEFVLVMSDMIKDADAYHIANNLTCAIVERGESLQNKILRDNVVLEGEGIKDMAVCIHCDLYTIRKLKQCECKMGFFYCCPECQAAHWQKGHREFHRIMEFLLH